MFQESAMIGQLEFTEMYIINSANKLVGILQLLVKRARSHETESLFGYAKAPRKIENPCAHAFLSRPSEDLIGSTRRNFHTWQRKPFFSAGFFDRARRT